MDRNTRTEHDSLGAVQVPQSCYWGAQTERSRLNFQAGEEKIPFEVIHALALIKKAAARVNCELGVLSKDRADLIAEVCDEILAGHLNDHFPLVVWQTGSGTQTHMNLNEVIANRASEKCGQPLGSHRPIHPNDDVNRSQSSNDVFPSAMHISSLLLIQRKLLPALELFHQSLLQKSIDFQEIVKVGRTHLMDAAPLTLGQEFSGYAVQIQEAMASIRWHLKPLHELALGGTAVGTGLNAPREFGTKAAQVLSELSGYPFVTAPNKFAALASHDPLVGLSGALRQTAVAYLKIADDICWMASGPRAGLGELILPANEPGSSIMPGKINPTQCEAMKMVALQVLGNDQAIAIAGSQGNFELNAYKPLIIYNLLRSTHLLSDTAQQFVHKCLAGIEPDRKRIAMFLSHSLMLATALNPEIGYDRASQVVQVAYREGISLKEATLQLGFLTAQRFDEVVDPKKMVGP